MTERGGGGRGQRERGMEGDTDRGGTERGTHRERGGVRGHMRGGGRGQREIRETGGIHTRGH